MHIYDQSCGKWTKEFLDMSERKQLTQHIRSFVELCTVQYGCNSMELLAYLHSEAQMEVAISDLDRFACRNTEESE